MEELNALSDPDLLKAQSSSTVCVNVDRWNNGVLSRVRDEIVGEEPLQIDVVWYRRGRGVRRPVSVTMRTPPVVTESINGRDANGGFDDDQNLAIGFLLTERVIRDLGDVVSVDVADNVASVHFHPGVVIELCDLRRRSYTTSACGVCGKTTIDQVMLDVDPVAENSFVLPAAGIVKLPHQLREQQTLFEQTGGLHGCGLVTATGRWIATAEDVGRHNAVDKLIGSVWRSSPQRFSESALVLSGRVSFELVQKAAVAGIPMIIAVGAPSSLAVATADRFQQTLIGFVRGERYNIYSHPHRIRSSPSNIE